MVYFDILTANHTHFGIKSTLLILKWFIRVCIDYIEYMIDIYKM